jgi:hypothetical protein
MPSRTTCRTDSPEVAAQKAAIAELERRLWADGLDETLLEPYQAAHRELERRIAGEGADDRHRFVVVVPVADRPQHLQSCLASLLELCRRYGYGSQHDGRYLKVAAFIADDSRDPNNIALHRDLARRFDEAGLPTTYFGLDGQGDLLNGCDDAARAALANVLGEPDYEVAGHKGSAVMRNIAYLKLAELADADERVLFHSIDSDQEFTVKVSTAAGDREVYALSFFHALDGIFSRTDAEVLTGKVVGDPPVSPAVMAGNFLDDVIDFLRQMAAAEAGAPCSHHRTDARRQGEAAYHDMADLFGFKQADAAYRYRCTLGGSHSEADCFAQFAARLGSFFYGEHPTRVSYYLYAGAPDSVQPARTVYTGNYVFRPEGLRYFVPFAGLRLRMLGPSLGRVIRSEIDGRFVSANLPMLHKRTVEDSGRSEFRPGIEAGDAVIELCGEFERQFQGDVMLFSLERLTAAGFPGRVPDPAEVAATVEAVHGEMLAKYQAKHEAIVDKLGRLKALLREPGQWWNRQPERADAVDLFESFIASMEHNFGSDSPCYARILGNWPQWRADLVGAIERYPADRLAWDALLAAVRAAPSPRD